MGRALIVLACVVSLLLAQPEAGSRMAATEDLILRSAPPSGALNTTGGQIGVVRKGERVIVRESRVVRNLFGAYLWCRVELNAQRVGWVYAGTVGGSIYLQPVR